jgi:hypothetical protein
MKLEFVPLLQVQRDLYRLPRGMERCRAYIQTMVDPKTKDIQLPLSLMNPIGNDERATPSVAVELARCSSWMECI